MFFNLLTASVESVAESVESIVESAESVMESIAESAESVMESIVESISGSASSVVDSAVSGGAGCQRAVSWLIILGFIAVYFFFSNRKYKKNQAEAEKKRAAICPGTKVTTIGYVKGVIVKVNEDNTFILETGDDNNKSYMQFDMRAIAEMEEPKADTETPVEEVPATEEAPAEETTEENK